MTKKRKPRAAKVVHKPKPKTDLFATFIIVAAITAVILAVIR